MRVLVLSDFCRLLEWILRPFCTPAYDPALWSFSYAHPYAQVSNNCYNYATNIRTDTFAQPGRASGHMYVSPPDCAGVGGGAVSDGLKPVDCYRGCGCSGCCHRVALFVSPGTVVTMIDVEDGSTYQWPLYDYHWYRLDDNGAWSHKPGAKPVTNRDASGNPISDPRTCDRGPYTTFCGCYCVCKGQVTIR
jgi:hypothetical protein